MIDAETAIQMRNTIHSVLSDTPDRMAVRALFEECHRFALTYLRCKRRGHYLKSRIGLSIEDLALDCIADLFERDQGGRFVHIEAYFNDAGWPNLSEQAATIALRRLVFSKVSDGLFRRYREADPQVAKIIRNVKLAVKASPCVKLVRKGNALWLVVSDADFSVRPAPLIPPELVEARILARLHESTTIDHVLSTFVELVETWPTYRNAYPLSAFARTIFDAFRRFGEISSEPTETEPFFMRGEIDDAVQAITEEVQSEMYGTYVERKKLRPSTFDAYCRAARDILASQFVPGATIRSSFFEALKFHLPQLTEADYRNDHRHVLEYLTKLARRRLVVHFERTLSS